MQPESQEPAFIDLMSQRDAFLSSPTYGAMESVIAGDRKMHDSSAKRHHFVPEMVLRNFALRNDADRIVQLDLERGAPRRRDAQMKMQSDGSTVICVPSSTALFAPQPAGLGRGDGRQPSAAVHRQADGGS